MISALQIPALLCTAFLFAGGSAPPLAQRQEKSIELLPIDTAYDKRTIIKPSTIPNGGNGLFAVARIKKGEVIGELGGQFISDDNYPDDQFYLAAIPECAWDKTSPYKYLDSKYYGANVSRINFAPRSINGMETGFQNAAIRQLCEPPYFIYVATKDIQPGQEIWSSYGEHYNYDAFMKLPEVRDFFCSRLRIDCRQSYTYEY
jgi:SET domain-containing protein